MGLVEWLELQVFVMLWNWLQLCLCGGFIYIECGVGDVGLVFKFVLFIGLDWYSVVLFVSSIFVIGDCDFFEGGMQYVLGVSYEYIFNDWWSGVLYVNVMCGVGVDEFIWLFSFSVVFIDMVSSYVELGFIDSDGNFFIVIVGVGVIWMLCLCVQLDVLFDVGLDNVSFDLQVGLGVLFYFDQVCWNSV